MVSDGRRLSVSTWSLHRTLGPAWWDSPQQPLKQRSAPWGEGTLDLLALPARLAQAGIHTLEICHFHLPRTDAAWLARLREALDAAGVALFSLLIDEGDLTHPQEQARDMAWISSWLAIAGQLGAERARVIAGKTWDAGAIARSRAALASLADIAESQGLRLMTENWYEVTADAERVCALLEPLRERVGLCVDFGNWKGAGKYAGFAQIMPYAESCHAKCHFPAPREPDAADFTRCLELTHAGDFNGPYTLIYEGEDADEWGALALEAELTRPWLA